MDKDELEKVIRKALDKCSGRCLDDMHDFNVVLKCVTANVFNFAGELSMERRLGTPREKN